MSAEESPRTPLRLDKPSPEFRDLLRDATGRMESDGPEKLVEVIDKLDKALDDLAPTSAAFAELMKQMREVCASYGVIPSSHILPASRLSINKSPFAIGGFSDVFQGKYDGSVVCIKKLRMASTSSIEKTRRMLYREALVWKRLKHANIVPFIGVTLHPLQIISEWMSRGNLSVYIKSNPDTNRVTLLADVARGLHYLHLCDVVHGDLKGPNIMVDASGSARITDFGLAYNQNALEHNHKSSSGTLRWMAPEILQEKGSPSKGADVFSFAMVMVEVFTGAAPFNIHPSVAATLVIMQGQRPPRPDHPGLTEKLWKLMQRCWDQEPQLRPEMSEVLEVLQQPDMPPTVEPPPLQIMHRGKVAPKFPSRKNTSPTASRPTSVHENQKSRSRVGSQTALQEKSSDVKNPHPNERRWGQPSGTIARSPSRRNRVTSEPSPMAIDFRPLGFGSIHVGRANPTHDYTDRPRKHRVGTTDSTYNINGSNPDINRKLEHDHGKMKRSNKRDTADSRSRLNSGIRNQGDPARNLSLTSLSGGPSRNHLAGQSQHDTNFSRLRRRKSDLDTVNVDDGFLPRGLSGDGPPKVDDSRTAHDSRHELPPGTRSPRDSWVHVLQGEQGPHHLLVRQPPRELPPETMTDTTGIHGNTQEQATQIPHKKSGLWGRLKKSLGFGKGWK